MYVMDHYNNQKTENSNIGTPLLQGTPSRKMDFIGGAQLDFLVYELLPRKCNLIKYATRTSQAK